MRNRCVVCAENTTRTSYFFAFPAKNPSYFSAFRKQPTGNKKKKEKSGGKMTGKSRARWWMSEFDLANVFRPCFPSPFYDYRFGFKLLAQKKHHLTVNEERFFLLPSGQSFSLRTQEIWPLTSSIHFCCCFVSFLRSCCCQRMSFTALHLDQKRRLVGIYEMMTLDWLTSASLF